MVVQKFRISWSPFLFHLEVMFIIYMYIGYGGQQKEICQHLRMKYFLFL